MDSLIIKAAQFADIAHNGQRRKYTNQPYITHPARVAARAMLLRGATPEMVAAAWLHDVVEDCNITLANLQYNFGPTVANYVEELTNPPHDLPKPRAERKAMQREHLRRATVEAKQIKLLDRIDNLRELSLAPADFQAIYLNESEMLLEVLADAHQPLASELADIIEQMRKQAT